MKNGTINIFEITAITAPLAFIVIADLSGTFIDLFPDTQASIYSEKNECNILYYHPDTFNNALPLQRPYSGYSSEFKMQLIWGEPWEALGQYFSYNRSPISFTIQKKDDNGIIYSWDSIKIPVISFFRHSLFVSSEENKAVIVGSDGSPEEKELEFYTEGWATDGLYYINIDSTMSAYKDFLNGDEIYIELQGPVIIPIGCFNAGEVTPNYISEGTVIDGDNASIYDFEINYVNDETFLIPILPENSGIRGNGSETAFLGTPGILIASSAIDEIKELCMIGSTDTDVSDSLWEDFEEESIHFETGSDETGGASFYLVIYPDDINWYEKAGRVPNEIWARLNLLDDHIVDNSSSTRDYCYSNDIALLFPNTTNQAQYLCQNLKSLFVFPDGNYRGIDVYLDGTCTSGGMPTFSMTSTTQDGITLSAGAESGIYCRGVGVGGEITIYDTNPFFTAGEYSSNGTDDWSKIN